MPPSTTTRLVVVMRDAGNPGSQGAQPCRAPTHVRAVTASCSPPPRAARCAGAPSTWAGVRPPRHCRLAPSTRGRLRGRSDPSCRIPERMPILTALNHSPHLSEHRRDSVSVGSPSCDTGPRTARPPIMNHGAPRENGVPKWVFPASPTGDMSLAPRPMPCALGGWRNVRRLCGSRALYRDAHTLIRIRYWCLIPGPTARRDEEPHRDSSSGAECQRAYASNDADCLTEREVGHTREPEQTSKDPSGNNENAAACHARSGSRDDFFRNRGA